MRNKSFRVAALSRSGPSDCSENNLILEQVFQETTVASKKKRERERDLATVTLFQISGDYFKSRKVKASLLNIVDMGLNGISSRSGVRSGSIHTVSLRVICM